MQNRRTYLDLWKIKNEQDGFSVQTQMTANKMKKIFKKKIHETIKYRVNKKQYEAFKISSLFY